MATVTRLASLEEATGDLSSGPWTTQIVGWKLPLAEASAWQLNAG